MIVDSLEILNFRGIEQANISFKNRIVIVGDNNTGKTTIIEALDLVLGPDRINRFNPINEHDFYAGEYQQITDEDGITEKCITISVTLSNLSQDQRTRFINHLEWVDLEGNIVNQYSEGVELIPILRVFFEGYYEPEEDDFIVGTYFQWPNNNNEYQRFSKKDKQICGFLYLRALRTGSRALSLQPGSLLDIILRIKESRPKMWENVLEELRAISVAADPALGLTETLGNVEKSVGYYLPKGKFDNPSLKVSKLTRDDLRSILTVYSNTHARQSNGSEYYLPYFNQGTGTINAIVLSLLTVIADNKDENVIFVMEEPETSIPPYTQKRIIHGIIDKSQQSIFTSHSPFVLEEFSSENILVVSKHDGTMLANYAGGLPKSIKLKDYRSRMKRDLCEVLLADHVLICEGNTEYDVYEAASQKLHQLDSENFLSLDNLGVAKINVEGDSKVLSFVTYFKGLNKTVYVAIDKQNPDISKEIHDSADFVFEGEEHGIEMNILENVDFTPMKRFCDALIESVEWPQQFFHEKPQGQIASEEHKNILKKIFKNNKTSGLLANFVYSLTLEEMPDYIIEMLKTIKSEVFCHDETTRGDAELQVDEEV